MKRSRIALAVGLAITGMAVSTSIASAATVVTPTPVAPLAGCADPVLSQPFSFVKDFNFYTLAPGGTFNSAASAGWELRGGAAVVQATQSDATTGGALDLPSKSQATSPVLCITSDYP